jgi:hypothetical protein
LHIPHERASRALVRYLTVSSFDRTRAPSNASAVSRYGGSVLFRFLIADYSEEKCGDEGPSDTHDQLIRGQPLVSMVGVLSGSR